jgi:hypothetical protein
MRLTFRMPFLESLLYGHIILGSSHRQPEPHDLPKNASGYVRSAADADLMRFGKTSRSPPVTGPNAVPGTRIPAAGHANF